MNSKLKHNADYTLSKYSDIRPGVRPTNNISIEFEIPSKFGEIYFKIYWTNHNKILHKSRQLHCRDVCKIYL